MQSKQMDPAPEKKAGSEEFGKVWDSSKCAMVAQSDQVQANTSDTETTFDESKLVVAVSKSHVPASFFQRESFATLDKLGLAKLPESPGFTLAYHSVSFQWHARWASAKKNFAPTHGAQRSELKALCMSLVQLWEWYLSVEEDPAGQEFLAKLRKYESEISF